MKTVTLDQLGEMCRALDLPPENVRTLVATPDAVSVTLYVRDEEGRKSITDDGELNLRYELYPVK